MKKSFLKLFAHISPKFRKKKLSEKDFIKVTIKLDKNNLSQEEKESNNKKILEKIELLPEFEISKNILIFWNETEDLNCTDLIMKWKDKKHFILPFSKHKDVKLKKIIDIKIEDVNEGTSYNPVLENFSGSLDLAILPGIAFDKKRNRMGHGKGFYKSILWHKDIYTVGVAYDCQILDRVPTFWKDLKMGKVITPTQTFK